MFWVCCSVVLVSESVTCKFWFGALAPNYFFGGFLVHQIHRRRDIFTKLGQQGSSRPLVLPWMFLKRFLAQSLCHSWSSGGGVFHDRFRFVRPQRWKMFTMKLLKVGVSCCDRIPGAVAFFPPDASTGENGDLSRICWKTTTASFWWCLIFLFSSMCAYMVFCSKAVAFWKERPGLWHGYWTPLKWPGDDPFSWTLWCTCPSSQFHVRSYKSQKTSNAMVLPPPWVTGQMEAPAQTKDMGGWKALVYTPEQQERLGVNEFGSKVIKVAKETMTATNDALRFGIGDRVSCNMGSECWASGKVVALHYRENGWPAETTAPYQVKLDPAFGSALIYAPEDTLETIRVYTPEQQERLGCECHGAAGNSKAEVTRDDDGALRFGIGDRVSCNLGLRCWASGTVVALHYQEKNWPPNATAPYQVKLDPAFGGGHIYVNNGHTENYPHLHPLSRSWPKWPRCARLEIVQRCQPSLLLTQQHFWSPRSSYRTCLRCTFASMTSTRMES